ncbi:MAG: flavin reductase [Novosphingobium sp.]|nr:flavin reductase [Novosphingobium sp.]
MRAESSGRELGTNDAADFRAALGSFVTGVTIVTASDGAGRDVGVTANSFNSVSLDPPMVLWSLARKSASLPVFAQSSHFAVHILAADQEDLSDRFARSGPDKFAGIALERGAGGAPLLPGAAARFQCRTAFQHDGGDHVIFVGEVETFERSARAPLAFHGGRYAVAARKAASLSEASPAPVEPKTFGEDFLGYLLGRADLQVTGRLRPVLERLGLAPREHFVLSAIGTFGEVTPARLAATPGFTGQRLCLDETQALIERGMIARDAAGSLSLSEAGRAAFVELTAAAMAIEDDIADGLDETELAMLRHLLKRVIAATDPATSGGRMVAEEGLEPPTRGL